MSAASAIAFALEIPGMLRLGALQVPVFGVLAALGVVLALTLSQYTARLARVDASRLWNAGLVMIASAFIASRLILIAAAPRVFAAFPMAILTLPSLTIGGTALAALATFAWLRFRRLSVLDVLDAWSPCACTLAAVLALAHFLEGTDAGMPTRLPWGVVTPGDTVLGRVHPVELYACVAWIALGAFAWRRLSRRWWSGQAAAWTMALGGVISFLLDMLRQPVESQGSAWLDPAQYVALAAAAAGAWMLLRPWMEGPRPWPCGGVVGADETIAPAASEDLQEIR
jgi:phosphatidylglycerol:prolipoprotein diacylglycerol transferase